MNKLISLVFAGKIVVVIGLVAGLSRSQPKGV